MQISQIKIQNILGITELEFTPQGFTTIQGPNGTGKTSVLEAIKAALSQGHDATLLRNGAEKGEIVLVLDDGTEIAKTVTESGSNTAIRRDGKKIARPAETIKALTDMLSVNPIDFLLAKPKDRVRVLLEAMPLEADAGHLEEIAGVPVRAMPGVHALHVIDQVYQQVYDERTGTNRAVKEKTATINQLEAAIPPDAQGIEGDENELQGRINAAADNRDETLGKIAAKLDKLAFTAHAAISEIRAKAQAEIDNISAALNEQKEKAAAAREKAKTTYAETVAPLTSQIDFIRRDREAAGRRKQTLETIGNLRTELETLTADATRQTQALDALNNYKAELLSSLPIPGVEVRDGELYRNGVVFDRLNTAQKVEIAVELAKLRAADLGVVCVDGLELLDSSTFEAFRDSALESKLQLFVTRVGDNNFSIESV